VQWAAWAIARDARGQAYLALGITALLGLAFINQTSFLYNVAGVTMEQPAGPYFYAVTGAQLAMCVAALAMLAVMVFKTLGGQYSSTNPDGLSALAIFWQAMVAMYAVIWIAVYVMK
jgi:heme/copper-type cytochrome/quinol oxidase subunit 3